MNSAIEINCPHCQTTNEIDRLEIFGGEFWLGKEMECLNSEWTGIRPCCRCDEIFTIRADICLDISTHKS